MKPVYNTKVHIKKSTFWCPHVAIFDAVLLRGTLDGGEYIITHPITPTSVEEGDSLEITWKISFEDLEKE